ncbi:TPA: hypothetical protein ACSCYS_004294 [Aeromonas veronii]
MEFTVEQLLKAIRDADSLADLKKMVGPAKDAQEESAARLAALDRCYEQYGAYGEHWPEHAKKLWDAQELYEQENC